MNNIDDLIDALKAKEEACLQAYKSGDGVRFYGSHVALEYALELANELKLNMEKNNNE
jgi:hypothetical protein